MRGKGAPLVHIDEPIPIVHVVDDDSEMRTALGWALSLAGYSVHVHPSATDFLEAVNPVEWGCVITDVRMPDMSGIELLAAMKERNIALPAIVITAYAEIPVAVQAMKMGAADYIEKPFHVDIVLKAVSHALLSRNGKVYDSETRKARLATLSARERDVLNGLLEGHQNKVIAHDLGISTRTVEVHRARIMSKMQASNVRDLMRIFFAPLG